MFVKYSKGTTGVVEYLKLGVSKDRDFSREEMDYRQILHGDIEELDILLKRLHKPHTIGDNYKHFVITFENDNTINQDLVDITNEFKEFAKYGYEDDELYFYAEAHIPKLKGYPFMSGEYNHRKPHVHVIIPVYNLYTGNKGYNFNIGTFKYRKYLDLFTKHMNYKYNLSSPFEPENKKLLKGNSNQIFRKTGKKFNNKNLEVKLKILELIVNKKITNQKELGMIIKLHIPNIISINYGDLNKNILILNFNDNVEHSKSIALRDYAFSQEFLSLTKEKQISIYENYLDKNNKNKIGTNIYTYNSKLTKEEHEELKTYKEIVSKMIKYSKIKPIIIHDIKDKDKKVQLETINLVEKEFYERNKNARTARRFDVSYEANLNSTEYNIKRIKIDTITKQNYLKVFSGRSRGHKGRVKSIHDFEINKGVLNKVLEIKYGSNPNYTFEKNYNLLSLEQKSEYYLFVSKNLKDLKEVNFEKPETISNFYNGELNEKLIDNYKAWLKMNSLKISNKVLGIEPEEKWESLKLDLEISKEQKELLNEYKNKKNVIETKYKNQSKLKRKHLKILKNEYQDVIKINNKKVSKKIRENLQIVKPSLRNNTIVNDSYLQFLKWCLEKKIIIPKENIKDVENYIILADICKNKSIKNNIVIQRDIIKHNLNLDNNINLSEEEILNKLEYEFIEGYDSFIETLEEELDKEDKIEIDETTHEIKKHEHKHLIDLV